MKTGKVAAGGGAGFLTRKKRVEKPAEGPGRPLPKRNYALEAAEAADLLLARKEATKANRSMLLASFGENILGRAIVFEVSNLGKVAGCRVIDGKIQRSANVRLIRHSKVIHEGKLSMLRRFKEDAREVRAGIECCMTLENFPNINEGDEIECRGPQKSREEALVEMQEAVECLMDIEKRFPADDDIKFLVWRGRSIWSRVTDDRTDAFVAKGKLGGREKALRSKLEQNAIHDRNRDHPYAHRTTEETTDETSEQIEGLLPHEPSRTNELLDSWLAAKGVAEDARPAFITKINQMVDAIDRPQWVDRKKYPHLMHLSAPRFLRAVYPDAIDRSGRLTNEEVVRLGDSKLVGAVQRYINERVERSLGLGDAEGLVFTKKDGRGRPKKPKAQKKQAPRATLT